MQYQMLRLLHSHLVERFVAEKMIGKARVDGKTIVAYSLSPH
jgi:hypothetical protein